MNPTSCWIAFVTKRSSFIMPVLSITKNRTVVHHERLLIDNVPIFFQVIPPQTWDSFLNNDRVSLMFSENISGQSAPMISQEDGTGGNTADEWYNCRSGLMSRLSWEERNTQEGSSPLFQACGKDSVKQIHMNTFMSLLSNSQNPFSSFIRFHLSTVWL